MLIPKPQRSRLSVFLLSYVLGGLQLLLHCRAFPLNYLRPFAVQQNFIQMRNGFGVSFQPMTRAMPATSQAVEQQTMQQEFSLESLKDMFARKKTKPSTLVLYSLKWTPDDAWSQPCRDLWKWKDASLGDGRDFFVPKPKTLGALQEYLIRNCPTCTEISVLSNCARLEVLCVLDDTEAKGWSDIDLSNTARDLSNEQEVLLALSECFVAQIKEEKKRTSTLGVPRMLTQSMDVPEWTLSLDIPPVENGAISQEAIELSRHWDIISGPYNILSHVGSVAAGMARRPRRPDRPAIFRPFSSRDAHILLQLKRTKEIVYSTNESRSTIDQVWEYALRMGKVARNPKAIPALLQLQGFGTGDSKKYAADVPPDLLANVSQIVFQEGLSPLIEEGTKKLESNHADLSGLLQAFREVAESMPSTQEGIRWMKRRLHEPTMAIRSGELQPEEFPKELETIQRELDSFMAQEAE